MDFALHQTRILEEMKKLLITSHSLSPFLISASKMITVSDPLCARTKATHPCANREKLEAITGGYDRGGLPSGVKDRSNGFSKGDRGGQHAAQAPLRFLKAVLAEGLALVSATCVHPFFETSSMADVGSHSTYSWKTPALACSIGRINRRTELEEPTGG
jgi:hypothetical protein